MNFSKKELALIGASCGVTFHDLSKERAAYAEEASQWNPDNPTDESKMDSAAWASESAHNDALEMRDRMDCIRAMFARTREAGICDHHLPLCADDLLLISKILVHQIGVFAIKRHEAEIEAKAWSEVDTDMAFEVLRERDAAIDRLKNIGELYRRIEKERQALKSAVPS